MSWRQVLSMILWWFIIISLFYLPSKLLSRRIGKSRGFLSEESLETLSELKIYPKTFYAMKSLTSFDALVLLSVIVLSSSLGIWRTMIIVGIASVVSCIWDSIITSLVLTSDVRGGYRVLRFTMSGAIMAALYISMGVLWLFALSSFLAIEITKLDIIMRAIFILIFITILDWAMNAFNYGYGIIGAITSAAGAAVLIYPIDFLEGISLPSFESFALIFLVVPLLLFLYRSWITSRKVREGVTSSSSTLPLWPIVTLVFLAISISLIFYHHPPPVYIRGISEKFLGKYAPLISIIILFFPFPRFVFSVHYSLSLSEKVEERRIAKGSVISSLTFFVVSILIIFAIAAPSYLNFEPITQIALNELPIIFLSLSVLSIYSVFFFSMQGLEVLSQRVPSGKLEPKVAKLMFLTYYFAIPFIIIPLGYSIKFLPSIATLIGTISTLVSLIIFLFSLKFRKGSKE